jgi:hypothetical protein
VPGLSFVIRTSSFVICCASYFFGSNRIVRV